MVEGTLVIVLRQDMMRAGQYSYRVHQSPHYQAAITRPRPSRQRLRAVVDRQHAQEVLNSRNES